jgi:hypothetical protein
MATILNPPPVSEETDWRIPRPSDRFTDVLKQVAHNGEWHVITRNGGFTVGEQQARSLNTGQGPYEWGYRVYASNGVLVSDLAVRWVGDRK